MTHLSRIKSLNLPGWGFMILALALAGCNRDQVKVQQVPKETEPAAQMPTMSAPAESPNGSGMPANPHAGMDMGMGGAARPQLKWTVPSGWKEKAPSEMRVGSFDATGKDGQSADISIIPLPTGGPQMELANLNMWRSSLQLPPADKVETTSVTVGGEPGKLYEVGDGKTAERILVAALDHGGETWYFKIRGQSSMVEEQKPAFMEFVKTISFEAAPAMSMEPIPADAAVNSDISPSAGVVLPPGWKEIPNPQMLLAKYVIQSGDARADVNISMLSGTGGGVMMNVTRWRGQLGLTPMSEEDFSKQVRTVDVAGGKGTLVDMTGTDAKTGKKARLIGVIAPQGGETWFYKLMGDEQIVGQQQDAFTKFIQTAKFASPN